MLITQEIKLELDRIDFVENPMNERGKFIAYQFRMYWPLESAFFNEKWPTSADNDLTVVWGSSPEITYYAKDNIKQFKTAILEKIKENLPDNDLTIDTYRLAWTGASKMGNRDWSIWYTASKRSRIGMAVVDKKVESHVPLNKDFMARLISLIPEKVKGKFEPKEK